MKEIQYIDVAIALKNGAKKMGLLISNDAQTEPALVRYVPSDKTELYAETKDPSLVETIASSDVSFIDSYFK